MEKPKITFKNISQFLEGNTKLFLSEIGFQPQHIKEQIAYRRLICDSTCGVAGKCLTCNCDYPAKLYVVMSCNNGEKFPDLMSKPEWEEFKIKNNINNE